MLHTAARLKRLGSTQSVLDRPDHVGKPRSHPRAFAQFKPPDRIEVRWVALEAVQGREQLLETLGQESLPESRIGARPRDIRLGHLIHDTEPVNAPIVGPNLAAKGCPNVPEGRAA